MMPLPSLLEADTYDDDGSSDSDCEEIQIKYNYKDNEIEASAQMHEISVGCSAITKESLHSPATCRPEKYSGYFYDNEIDYRRDYSISSAATVDILESDLNEVPLFDHFEVTRIEQFPYQRMHLAEVEEFINRTSEDTFPERRMTTEFLKYVSSIVPRIMV